MSEPASVTLEVSVVVPVYNPGRFIEPCIASLLAQTMPADRLELIFVDDASTDDTPALLDQVAAEHPQVRVIHRETPSGWSGRPRNDGIEVARGRFIHFVDQDDSLGPEALVRMTQLAERTGADIVIGKVISNGRKVSSHLLRRNRDTCSIRDLPLEDSLTPHKLFRRSMLMEHGIRFPTAKRLEDQPFLMQCYFAAANVSILADYPCYFFSKRDDGANLSFSHLDPVVYYRNLSATLDIVERGIEPGPVRTRILRRFYRAEILGRLSEPAILRVDPVDREGRFTEARALALARFPDEIPDALAAVTRMRADLLRAGDLDAMVRFAERVSSLTGWVEAGPPTWRDRKLRIPVRAGLRRADGTALELLERDGRIHLDPQITDGILDTGRTALGPTEDLAKLLRLEAVITDRASFVDWPVTVDAVTRLAVERKGSGLIEPVVTGELTVSMDKGAGGRALSDGIWDLSVRVLLPGVVRTKRVHLEAGAAGLPAPVLTGGPARFVTTYATEEHDNLSLDVGATKTSMTDALARQASGDLRARQSGEDLLVALPFAADGVDRPGKRGATWITLTRGEQTLRLRGELFARGASAAVRAGLRAPSHRIPTGTWDVTVRLDSGDGPGVAAGRIRLRRLSSAGVWSSALRRRVPAPARRALRSVRPARPARPK